MVGTNSVHTTHFVASDSDFIRSEDMKRLIFGADFRTRVVLICLASPSNMSLVGAT